MADDQFEIPAGHHAHFDFHLPGATREDAEALLELLCFFCDALHIDVPAGGFVIEPDEAEEAQDEAAQAD